MTCRVVVAVGDITREEVDAIVNAANSTLIPGGGVDGAIQRAGGAALLEARRKVKEERYPEGLPTGEAVATEAGNLPARWVIHTVGPVWGHHDGQEEQLLAACYANCLRIASELGCRSIAFPAVSTGIFGFPRERAAAVAGRAVGAFVADRPDALDEVRLVFFSAEDAEVFRLNSGLPAG